MGVARKGARERADPVQLPLGIGLRSGSSFANLVAGDNDELVQALRGAIDSRPRRVVYFWGGVATGKTHLLEACCAEVAGRQRRVVYVPLGAARECEPRLLEGLAQYAYVCVDDTDTIAGERAWEEALFHLFNRCEGAGSSLFMAARRSPSAAGFRLPELASRLASGLVFRVRPLSDGQRMAALRLHAGDRGIDLPVEVASYILHHYSRDMSELVRLLERLDRTALAAQRRLTVPFVRSSVESSSLS